MNYTVVDGCWVHNNKPNKDGYVNLCVRNSTQRNVLAHRASYELNVGRIPEGMIVCHSCDNPKCINPAHLFIGTHEDNAKDRDSKNRGDFPWQRGELHPMSTISDAEVSDIRGFHQLGLSQTRISQMTGVKLQQVNRIVNYKQRIN